MKPRPALFEGEYDFIIVGAGSAGCLHPHRAMRDEDDPQLVKAASDIGTTIFHPVGTATMGFPAIG